MDAMEFVANYESMLESFRPYVTADMEAAIERLLEETPEELVSPGTRFPSRAAALGFLWMELVKECNDLNATRPAT
jgi:hypothetical protein